MDIEVNIDVNDENRELVFKIIDLNKEFIYNYMYDLNTLKNISSLCIFLHNSKEIDIKKNNDNYLKINENGIEIKTENSYVNQKGKINIKELHTSLIKLLYKYDYIKMNISFSPSKRLLDDYKFKKNIIVKEDIIEQKNNLKKKYDIEQLIDFNITNNDDDSDSEFYNYEQYKNRITNTSNINVISDTETVVRTYSETNSISDLDSHSGSENIYPISDSDISEYSNDSCSISINSIESNDTNSSCDLFFPNTKTNDNNDSLSDNSSEIINNENTNSDVSEIENNMSDTNDDLFDNSTNTRNNNNNNNSNISEMENNTSNMNDTNLSILFDDSINKDYFNCSN